MATEKQQPQAGRASTLSQAKSWGEVQNTLADLKNSYGFVPDFVNSMPVQSLPGSWIEAKSLFYNRNTALDPKIKDLIGYAIAVQMPSDMLKYFNHSMASQDGATQQELSEAMLMSAITRHWSTVLNGSQIDKAEFRKEADQIMANVGRMMRESKGQLPPEEAFLTKFNTAQEAYDDMDKAFGLVPKFFRSFPEEGIAGAWSEFKAVQLNPYTAIDNKNKELIGLSVAAQIPCDYCIYFHRSAAQLFGATDREIREAIGLSALSRHWSVIFQSSVADLAGFKSIADKMISGAKSQAQSRLHS